MDLDAIDPYPPVAGQWLFERLAWLVTTEAAALLHRGLVADLRPERVRVRNDEGALPIELTVLDPPVPGDAAAARASIRAGLQPLASELAARKVRPERALWRAADDRIAYAALEVEGADAAALARALGAELRPHPTLGHRRASCCLAHRAQEPSICEACPLMGAPRFR